MRIIFAWNNKPIRLPHERWRHIAEQHQEMAELMDLLCETLRNPSRVFLGNTGEFIAVSEIKEGCWLVVIYRELVDDGFVITAFTTKRPQWFTRRRQIWP